MRRSDKILAGIVSGIIILVIVAFVVGMRQPQQVYQDESLPEGVVHNYLLALQQRDYERAYRHLSPTLPGYPESIQRFIDDIESTHWTRRLDSEVALTIASTRTVADRATVTVREAQFQQRGLFDSNQSVTTFSITLLLTGDTWKITDSDAYWHWCWKQIESCPNRQPKN